MYVYPLSCSNELQLIASRAELFGLVAIWCRTGASVFPRVGYSSFTGLSASDYLFYKG